MDTKKTTSDSQPAGWGSSADSQLAGCGISCRDSGSIGSLEGGAGGELPVLIENDRDRRGLAWLQAQVSDQAIAEACGRLPGARRPYVSNVAKALGLKLPDELALTPRPQALERLAEIQQMLGKKSQ